MDDLDRTFLKLKRLDYTSLTLKLEAAGITTQVDYHSLDLVYPPIAEKICIESGWTLGELNAHVRTVFHELITAIAY